MNETAARQLIHTYGEGWKAGDRDQILDPLHPDCVIIESDGPIYRGKEKISRWVGSWFAAGNRVNSWDITSFFAANETCCFEWYSTHTFAGVFGGIEGASIAHLREEKIISLREYATVDGTYKWEG